MKPREKPAEAFVERDVTEADIVKREHSVRIPLKLTPDGKVDWDSLSDKYRRRFTETMRQDTATQEMLGLKPASMGAVPYEVKPEHVDTFLDVYCWLESYLLPMSIAARSKNIMRIPLQVSTQICVIPKEHREKLCPAGAQAANEHLPEVIRKFLLQTGPLAQFLGGMVMITVSHGKMMQDWWKQQHAEKEPAKTNGQAVEVEVVQAA